MSPETLWTASLSEDVRLSPYKCGINSKLIWRWRCSEPYRCATVAASPHETLGPILCTPFGFSTTTNSLYNKRCTACSEARPPSSPSPGLCPVTMVSQGALDRQIKSKRPRKRVQSSKGVTDQTNNNASCSRCKDKKVKVC